VKSAFTKLLAAVRTALEQEPLTSVDHGTASSSLPTSAAGRRTELVAQFAHELERVNGHFMGAVSARELSEAIQALIRELGPGTIAVGGGIEVNLAPTLRLLQRSGVELIRFPVGDDEEPTVRERLARCDLAMVEADYAIAATGTLVVVASPARPGSLTLLPPANVLLVRADRVLPDMAAVVSALGPGTFVDHRVVFITGPSRTADIEKKIVLGVHGPKHLYAAAVWPGKAAPSGTYPE
jgi:L-lactate dehydrogenase complex protein LldG